MMLIRFFYLSLNKTLILVFYIKKQLFFYQVGWLRANDDKEFRCAGLLVVKDLV